MKSEKNCWNFLQKRIAKEFRIEKVLRRKGNKLYVKWKGYDNSFNSWIDKKQHCIKTSQHFPKLYKAFGENITVELDLFSYATKAELKNAIGIDTFNFALKSKLASLKIEVDKLDIDKLVPVQIDQLVMQ